MDRWSRTHSSHQWSCVGYLCHRWWISLCFFRYGWSSLLRNRWSAYLVSWSRKIHWTMGHCLQSCAGWKYGHPELWRRCQCLSDCDEQTDWRNYLANDTGRFSRMEYTDSDCFWPFSRWIGSQRSQWCARLWSPKRDGAVVV